MKQKRYENNTGNPTSDGITTSQSNKRCQHHEARRFAKPQNDRYCTYTENVPPYSTPWVSNPRPAELYYAARGHICKLFV
jgi:hypothetical protein